MFEDKTPSQNKLPGQYFLLESLCYILLLGTHLSSAAVYTQKYMHFKPPPSQNLTILTAGAIEAQFWNKGINVADTELHLILKLRKGSGWSKTHWSNAIVSFAQIAPGRQAGVLGLQASQSFCNNQWLMQVAYSTPSVPLGQKGSNWKSDATVCVGLNRLTKGYECSIKALSDLQVVKATVMISFPLKARCSSNIQLDLSQPLKGSKKLGPDSTLSITVLSGGPRAAWKPKRLRSYLQQGKLLMQLSTHLNQANGSPEPTRTDSVTPIITYPVTRTASTQAMTNLSAVSRRPASQHANSAVTLLSNIDWQTPYCTMRGINTQWIQDQNDSDCNYHTSHRRCSETEIDDLNEFESDKNSTIVVSTPQARGRNSDVLERIFRLCRLIEGSVPRHYNYGDNFELVDMSPYAASEVEYGSTELSRYAKVSSMGASSGLNDEFLGTPLSYTSRTQTLDVELAYDSIPHFAHRHYYIPSLEIRRENESWDDSQVSESPSTRAATNLSYSSDLESLSATPRRVR